MISDIVCLAQYLPQHLLHLLRCGLTMDLVHDLSGEKSYRRGLAIAVLLHD
jgi:hypothetical protein